MAGAFKFAHHSILHVHSPFPASINTNGINLRVGSLPNEQYAPDFSAPASSSAKTHRCKNYLSTYCTKWRVCCSTTPSLVADLARGSNTGLRLIQQVIVHNQNRYPVPSSRLSTFFITAGHSLVCKSHTGVIAANVVYRAPHGQRPLPFVLQRGSAVCRWTSPFKLRGTTMHNLLKVCSLRLTTLQNYRWRVVGMPQLLVFLIC